MIAPANRTQLVNEYYFSSKLKEIEELNRQGHKVINLGIGNPDMLPPEQALKQLSELATLEGVHGYQSYVGIPELRKAFADWYEKFFEVKLNPANEILPLMGSKEGIMHISLAFLNPGDGVLIPNPGYPTYRAVAELVGAKVIEYDLKPEYNWYPNFDELEKLDLSSVKIMWVNYPHMPTGQSASVALFSQLIEFGKKHQILICNDNPYGFILNDHPLSIFSIEGAKDIALELNSLSKSHNMAGFRIGMVGGHSSYIQSILKIKSNMDSGMYRPLQMTAVKALESNQDWYDRINEVYKNRRVLIWKIFDSLGAIYDKNQTGLFVWARIPETFSDSFEFSDVYLNEARVFITPGSIFGSNGNRYARISLCATEEVLQESLNRLEQVNLKLKEKNKNSLTRLI